jgi:hypothetical protein
MRGDVGFRLRFGVKAGCGAGGKGGEVDQVAERVNRLGVIACLFFRKARVEISSARCRQAAHVESLAAMLHFDVWNPVLLRLLVSRQESQ